MMDWLIELFCDMDDFGTVFFTSVRSISGQRGEAVATRAVVRTIGERDDDTAGAVLPLAFPPPQKLL
jgi:hypothetical protein